MKYPFLPAATLLCTLFAASASAQSADFTEVIRTQPEGELATYLRSGEAFFAYYGAPAMTTQEGTVIDIVYAPDGRNVYMKNPISQAASNTWIRGTRQDDGKIHVPLEQYVQFFDNYGYGWKTVILKMTSYNDFEGATYAIDPMQKEITFTVSDDTNTIALDNLGGGEGEGGYPGAMYALVYTDDETFVGYADYESVYTPYNLSYLTIPENLTAEQWTFTYSNAQEGEYEMLPVAYDADNIYIAGLSIHDPEAAIVGKIEDNHVSFPSDQYVGYHSGFLLYAFGADYEEKNFYDEEWDETYTTYAMTPAPALDMVFDFSTNTLRTDRDMALVLNMGKVNDLGINYMSVSLDPVFKGPEGSGILPHLPTTNVPSPAFDLYGRHYASPRPGISIIGGRKVWR